MRAARPKVGRRRRVATCERRSPDLPWRFASRGTRGTPYPLPTKVEASRRGEQARRHLPIPLSQERASSANREQPEPGFPLIPRWTVSLGWVLLSTACINPATVGEGRDPCEVDADCTPVSPYCDAEVLVCFQCLDASHCTGASPRCDEGQCVCESSNECSPPLICSNERCEEG